MFDEYAFVKDMTSAEVDLIIWSGLVYGPKIPAKEVLDELIYCHQCSVPFKTLDPHDFHREVDLHRRSFMKKS